MMEMANVYLPINGNWRRFYDKCENLSSTSMNKITREVIQIARNILEDMEKNSNENKLKENEKEERVDSCEKEDEAAPEWLKRFVYLNN
jgi:hypothetical protein